MAFCVLHERKISRIIWKGLTLGGRKSYSGWRCSTQASVPLMQMTIVSKSYQYPMLTLDSNPLDTAAIDFLISGVCELQVVCYSLGRFLGGV